ncbi:MAG: signal peptide peptidase SppA [Candidatus Cloacimonadaceae bacterium]|jgi:protease-4|nr:signal peptide peptidase SppA [Candidatus Cloacimonadota bacterium]MDD5624186.1 signal peptide peptidase SppA [Candidatus Cloacimonadota bacterium]MDY0111566.1 signal peptide peptidase SppA [Candidatus Syntrophosphaera sp.]
MKKNTGIYIGCGVVVLILIAAFMAGYFIGFAPKGKSVAGGSWLVLDLSGQVSDYSILQSSNFLGYNPLTVKDICFRIRKAADDNKIKGILIKPNLLQTNYANLNEIDAALQDFKKSHKPVIAHGEMLAQRDYLLCAMADKIYLDPSASAGIILEGIASNVLFYRDALKKLGIKMHIMQEGQFKGAAEPYTQNSLSPGTEENLRKVLKNRYELLQQEIAALRSIKIDTVQNIYENRPDLTINAQEAKKYGLIDEIATWEELQKKYDITDKYQISISNYQSGSEASVSGDKIAVIYLSGNITPSSSYNNPNVISLNSVDKILDKVEADKSIQAVVLRINSPGGSALESELIYQRIQALEKPVVISMGGMAASGGYYISCAGDYLIADPQTITGSIGVVMAIPEAEELGNKIGIESQTISYGKFAGAGNILEKTDPELLASLKRESASVYAEFKQRVMESRKIAADKIDLVAEGRVFAASDAKANGLIDEIGNLQFAIAKAAELAKITKYNVQTFPKKITLWDLLRQGNWFQINNAKAKEKDLISTEPIENYLEKTLPTNQWIYFCPYKLD